MYRNLTAIGLVAATMGLGLTACDNTGSGTARLSIKLTDAPAANITSAYVTISKIYLQGSQSEDPSAGQMVLLSTPVTTDLLTLSNDVLNLVENQVVKAGTYGQLRFVIDGGYIVVEENGETTTYATAGYDLPPGVTADGVLQCPSCGQSGIKVSFPEGALTLNEDKIVLVDFDVSETYGHEAGGSGSWVMHPSLKATDVQLSGVVTVMAKLDDGVTLPDLNGSATTLADFQAELRTADSDPGVVGDLADFTGPDVDGYFTATFPFVLPGDYDVNVLSPMELGTPLIDFTTDPVMPQSVTIGSDGSATVTYLITSGALH